MTCRIFIIVIIVNLLFASTNINAQIQVSGTVKDLNGAPIGSANVLFYDNGGNIISYTYTQTEGIYDVEIGAQIKEYLVLSAQSLGFQKKIDTLFLDADKNEYIFDFYLKEKIEQLNEVVLKPTEKISKQGNTTTYKIESFKDGTEQTVEDLLKRLPGIEVLKDGTIKAHGRYIDKLLVEGEDMFDKNYTVLSKNLDAKVLDTVEILDEFEDNPILAKVLKSEKIAINLVLKDNYKNIWFGNTSAGIGTKERNRLASNVGLIRKKIKFFNFNNYNNLGHKALDQIEGAKTSKSSFFKESRTEDYVDPIYIIQDNNNTIFGDGESTFNKAFINSLSLVTNLTPKLKLRSIGYYTNDIENQLFSSETTFNFDENPVTYFNRSVIDRRNSISGGEIELKFNQSETSYIRNVMVYNNRPEITKHSALFNQDIISENLKQKENSFYNHLNHSYLLNKKNVLHTYFYFGFNEVEQSSDIINPVLNTIFSQEEGETVNHASRDKLVSFGGKSNLLVTSGRLKSNLEIGFESQHEKRKNKFILENFNGATEIDSLQNVVDFTNQKINFSSNFEYPLSKNLDLNARFSLDYLNFDFQNIKKDLLLFSPRIRLSTKNLKIGYLSFTYSRGFSEPSASLFLQNYQLRSYQSFSRGAEEIIFPRNNRLSLNYQISNEVYSKTFSIRTQYAFTDKIYSSENSIGQDLIFTSAMVVNSGKVFSTNVDFTSYFTKLNISANIGTVQNLSIVPINANSSTFQPLKTYRSSYFITGTTYFKIPINFNFKVHFNRAKSRFNDIKTKTDWKTIKFNSTLKFSEALIASFSSNFYLLQNAKSSFVNFKIDCLPKKSRFSYQLVLSNLTNENLFSITNIDQLSLYNSNIQLLPRYIYVQLKYRF